jgi:nitronate monooxygenase
MRSPDTLRELLGVELPIVQAPMAGMQGAELAIAAAEAGALGSLPCAMLDAAGMRREIAALTAATRRPFNLNFFCHTEPPPDPERERRWRRALAPYFEELGLDPEAEVPAPRRTPFGPEAAAIVDDVRPSVVSFHFGLPPPELLARVKRAGARILASATTVAEARWLEARGVDAIVAQGFEAGGHRGHFLADDASDALGTFALVPRIARAVALPVIAAGGIADAAGVAAALALGASGVQVGSAYLLCPEARTSAVHRAALASDAVAHTVLTNLFSGRLARGIPNRLIAELGATHPAVPPFPNASAALAPLRAKAESLGRGDFSPLWAGQNVSGCRAVPAAEITRGLAEGVG